MNTRCETFLALAILLSGSLALAGDDAGGADSKPDTLLDARQPPARQGAVLESLLPDRVDEVLGAWRGLSPALREEALGKILANPTACRRLIAALREERMRPGELGARALYLLANHDETGIRKEARGLLAELGGRRAGDKKTVLEHLRPLVLAGAGNAAKGEVVFEKQSSVCHEYDGRGKDIGTNLTGMGLRGKESLLVDIVDPNREIEAQYLSYAIVKTNGETLSGMLASEDAERLVLKRGGGVDVVLRDDVLALESQGVSLMPEGLEKTMSTEELRDLLAYLCGESRHRSLNLRLAASADGSQGLFTMQGSFKEALPFPQYGVVELEGIPFQVLNPATTGGRNLIVLRGGPDTPGTLARGYPLRAEIRCGTTAKALHFLGGVGGWAFPRTKEPVPVMDVTLHYRGGASETLVWKNGVEIADSHRLRNVPASKRALRWGRRQVRLLTVKPSRADVIERIELVSRAGPVAPVLVAVTVEG
jgi:putative heme-binding domain-containing protein